MTLLQKKEIIEIITIKKKTKNSFNAVNLYIAIYRFIMN